MPPTTSPKPQPKVKVTFLRDTRINLGEGKFSDPYREGKSYSFEESTARYWIMRGDAVLAEAQDGPPEISPGAEGEKLTDLSIAELRALASEQKIDLGKASTKTEIAETIQTVLDSRK